MKQEISSTLWKEQRKFIDYAKNLLSNNDEVYSICEMPTAFGKTRSLLALSQIIPGITKKQVAIVVPNNALVKEYMSEAKNFNIEYSLQIGKTNYVNPDNIYFGEDYYDLEKANKFYLECFEKDGFLLIDDFLNFVNLDDPEVEDFIKKSVVYQEQQKRIPEPVEEGALIITNYPMLLITKLYQEKEEDQEKENIFYLFDEIHMLSECAESIMASSFSPYQMYQLSTRLQKELEQKSSALVPASLKEDIRKFSLRCKIVHDALINQNRADSVEMVNKKFITEKVAIAKKGLLSSALATSLQKKLTKYLQKNICTAGHIFLSEMKEGDRVFANEQDTALSFSKNKGFISFINMSINVKEKLTFKFWPKIDSFIGVTATANIVANPTGAKVYYCYTRIGINMVDLADKKTREIICRGKQYKCKTVKVFEGKLKKEQAKYHITSRADLIREESYPAMAEEILDNYDNRNTMVLIGSFEDAEKLTHAILSLEPNANVLLPKRGTSMTQTINLFRKEGLKKATILIATKNFGTGVNLPSKELEKLFIAKIPYPPFNNRKWLDLKMKNPHGFWFEYTNEMIIAFRQNIGRLIRTPLDEGTVYIIDSRVNEKRTNKESIKNTLVGFLDKIAEPL